MLRVKYTPDIRLSRTSQISANKAVGGCFEVKALFLGNGPTIN